MLKLLHNCGERRAYWFAYRHRHRRSDHRAWEGLPPVHLWKGKGAYTGCDAVW